MAITIEEYRKQLHELLAKGLCIDEADKVIDGRCTLEEALKNHQPFFEEEEEDLEAISVDMDSYEDAVKIMEVIKEITAKRSGKAK